MKNFTVKSEADEQTDLMIAQSVINARPFNKVNFVFNHILSNVNFYVKTSEEFDAENLVSGAAVTTTTGITPIADKKYFGFNKDYMLADKSTTKNALVALNFHHIQTLRIPPL